MTTSVFKAEFTDAEIVAVHIEGDPATFPFAEDGRRRVLGSGTVRGNMQAKTDAQCIEFEVEARRFAEQEARKHGKID